MQKFQILQQTQRQKVTALYNKIGNKEFYKKLVKLDPRCKNKISSNDKQRMIRFYEVKFYTKKSIFLWQKETQHNLKDYHFIKIFLNLPRPFLLKKINRRFNQMMGNGALKEALKFNNLGIRSQLTANNILGLKELVSYLNGKTSIDYAFERSIIRTRQYIKRQMTWFRGQNERLERFSRSKEVKFAKKSFKFYQNDLTLVSVKLNSTYWRYG